MKKRTNKKRIVKVIKRDADPASPRELTGDERRAQHLKEKTHNNRDMVNTVNDWISQRRENNKLEKLDDNRRFDR